MQNARFILIAISVLWPAELRAQFPTQSVKIEKITFQIPKDVAIRKVAAEPLIHWPIAADWDDDGNLVVVECHWDGKSVEEQLETKPHKLVRLSDTNDDGQFDLRTVVAEDLSFCEGILIEGNQAWITTPPTIQRLIDSNDDGKFDRREIWHNGGTLTYCANDLHGPMRGPDGWLYWTKGAFGEQKVIGSSGSSILSQASHIYRQHPDGRTPEIVVTAGMDNPADIGFLPNGDLLFCGTFFHHPSSGLRDGIAHGIYRSVFGKDHHVLQGHFQTGPLMTPIAELGPAAPAALLVLENEHRRFAKSRFKSSSTMQPLVLSAQFNLQKIGAHQLTAQNGSYTSADRDFIVGDRVDFHPVDILADQDGSLLVLDTGGWYDLCCPSSGIDDQIAPGGIYRLEFLSTAPAPSELSADEIELQNIWTQIRRLAVLSSPQESDWQPIVESIRSPHERVAQAAAHAIGLYRHDELRAEIELKRRLESASPALQRSLIEALGRLDLNSSASAVERINNALIANAGSRAVQHSAIIALDAQSTTAEVRCRLSHGSGEERWAALIILEQRGAIEEQDWCSLYDLRSKSYVDQHRLQEIFQTHPEFSRHLLPRLREQWLEGVKLDEFAQLVGAWRNVPAAQSFVAELLRETERLANPQLEAIANILRRFDGEVLPGSWIAGIVDWIQTATYPDLKTTLVPALQAVKWKLPRDQRIVDSLAEQLATYPEDLGFQLQILASLPAQHPGVPSSLGNALVSAISASETPSLSLQAARSLQKCSLGPTVIDELLTHVSHLPPRELRYVLQYLISLNRSELDERLIQLLPNVNSIATIPEEDIVSWLKPRTGELKQNWLRALETCFAPPNEVQTEIQRWLADLPEGDPVEGYNVFRSAKASCSSCHKVAYIGGELGPNLSKIGHSRSPSDLLEAILFPSQRIEQSYQATKVLTVDGKIINGMLISETEERLELLCNADEKCRVSLADIEQRGPSEISLMPNGLEKQLSKQQMADLLAFLMSRR